MAVLLAIILLLALDVLLGNAVADGGTIAASVHKGNEKFVSPANYLRKINHYLRATKL